MDETTTDVVPAGGGEQEVPTPDASTTDAGQDSPGGESQLDTVLQQVAELTGQVRALQSDKDKGVAQVSKEVKNLSKQYETYFQRRESGLSHEQALREDVLDSLVAERGVTPEIASVPPTEEPAVQPKVASEDYLSPILKMAGLDVNDSDVIAILRDESDPFKRITAVGALAETRKQKPPLTLGAALPSGGGQAVETETLDSVTAELQAEQAKPIRDMEKIIELSEKHKELLPRK